MYGTQRTQPAFGPRGQRLFAILIVAALICMAGVLALRSRGDRTISSTADSQVAPAAQSNAAISGSVAAPRFGTGSAYDGRTGNAINADVAGERGFGTGSAFDGRTIGVAPNTNYSEMPRGLTDYLSLSPAAPAEQSPLPRGLTDYQNLSSAAPAKQSPLPRGLTDYQSLAPLPALDDAQAAPYWHHYKAPGEPSADTDKSAVPQRYWQYYSSPKQAGD